LYTPDISPGVKRISLILLVTGLAATAWHLRVRHIDAAHEAVERVSREAGYVAAAAALQQVILPGMPREEVENILKARSIPFDLRSGAGTHDEIVPLGHEASANWSCNWEQVQLLITFAPAGTGTPSTPDSSGFSQAQPEDRVKTSKLDHWQRDCM
jgi:hypothetical protein